MRISLGPGHTLTGKGTGAVGFINESKENRVMFDLIKNYLEKDGHTVYNCTVDKDDNYLKKQVALANKNKADVAVQIHFNSSDNPSANGAEVLYVSEKGKVFAQRVQNKLATKFKNRGVVKRDNLYWLNNCVAPTILIEVCFVSSKNDTDIYNANKNEIARLIAEGILNKNLSNNSSPSKPNDSKYPNGNYDRKARTTNNLNVRTERSTNSTIVKTIPKGTILTVDYCLDNWFSTYDYKYNGKPCYVYGDYIELI